MEDINKKTSIWMLIKALIVFALFILGALFWFPANAVPRCAITWRNWLSHPLVIGDASILILSIYLALRALIALERKSRKTIRITTVLLVVSLIGSILLIIFTIYNSVKVVSSSCGAREVAIKADLSYLRESGDLYFEDNNGSYEGFCDNSEDVALVAGGIENNGSQLFCNDTSEEWASCAQLASDDYFCVDSENNVKTINGECDESWNYSSCP